MSQTSQHPSFQKIIRRQLEESHWCWQLETVAMQPLLANMTQGHRKRGLVREPLRRSKVYEEDRKSGSSFSGYFQVWMGPWNSYRHHASSLRMKLVTEQRDTSNLFLWWHFQQWSSPNLNFSVCGIANVWWFKPQESGFSVTCSQLKQEFKVN